MPQLPRAIVYLHLAQQLAEPSSRAELFECYPQVEQALSVLSSQMQAFLLEDALVAGTLRPGDLVVTPPRADSGHTGHMYTLERLVSVQARDEPTLSVSSRRVHTCDVEADAPGTVETFIDDIIEAPSNCAGTVAPHTARVVDAWIFIESRLKFETVPPGSGLPQMQGIRRNIRRCIELSDYCNRTGRPCFVLRLL
eukprot:gnl/TRDRNA2_/TRDRNA2_112046_c1_seq1.p2 gnl/TRDRNA2_/TRDRNA2_112046_c1~~gnl/TRDRNA2_/TRDRNA2_112046_c1_seq1.p2  ORF type:complete len:196 (+),score=34.29 gnl/TRDRNA2_/TRDRNA2_112046_c1_seq1:423-1010(+)